MGSGSSLRERRTAAAGFGPRRAYWLARGRAFLLALAALVTLVHCSTEQDEPPPSPSPSPTTSTSEPVPVPVPVPENASANPSASALAAEYPIDPAKTDDRPVVAFLGTSLTAGYGLPEDEAYPALIQTRLDEAGLPFRVVNAGVSGDTSAGGLRRLDWLLRLPIAVLVLELGANDMLRGQSIDALEANLASILERTRAAHPHVRFVVEGMRAAPNLGREYVGAFDALYPRLAERFDAAFVPFVLEDVAARPELNQADGMHPTAEGHALIAARVWKVLEPVAREAAAARGP